VAYASRSVSTAEPNYAITNLAILWAVAHFRYYLYEDNKVAIADHAAVKAILGVPNLTGQHAHWWGKLYGSWIKNIEINNRARINNQHADVLSRLPAPPDSDLTTEVKVANTITSYYARNLMTTVKAILFLPRSNLRTLVNS